MTAWYISPTGLVGNAGTQASPWDLASAITGHSGAILPGDTVWMLGGTYTSAVQLTASVSGTLGVGEDDPATKVKFRNMPGQKVVFDFTAAGDVDGFVIDGSYFWLWATVGQGEGIEVKRSWVEAGRASARGTCVWFRANLQNGNKLIHVYVHDGNNGVFCGNGAGNAADVGDLELYGVISLNNGNDATSRTHGLYLRHQSPAGKILRITGCIIGQQLGNGIQLFGSFAGSTGMDSIQVTKTIMFGAGKLGTDTAAWRNGIFAGSSTTAPIRGGKWNENVMFQPDGAASALNLDIGAELATNEDCECQDNYIVGGGSQSVQVYPFRIDGNPSIKFDRNFISAHGVAATEVVRIAQVVNVSGFTSWTLNTWHQDPTLALWRGGASGFERIFSDWKTQTGLGVSDSASAVAPSVNKVFVFPLRKFNDKYGHVCFFNWAASGTVAVDLSSILDSGDAYEVYNVQDIFGVPVLTGTYVGGTVNFPTTGKTPPAAIGPSPRNMAATAPFFDAFLVRRVPPAATTPGDPPRRAQRTVANAAVFS